MRDTQAIVFDLYGTLLHLAHETKPYKRLFQDLGLQTPDEFTQARRIALTEDFDNLASLTRRLKPDTQVNLAFYEQELREELASATLYPETLSVLERLREQRLKLGLISNLASPYKNPFFDLGLNKYFDEVLFSYDIGLRKPQPEIYQEMINQLRIRPTQALMTGDKVEADVNGPRTVGINAVYLDRTRNSTNSIHTLEGIFEHL